MKKVLAFIFSLFMGFASFGIVHAGDDKIPPEVQIFCNKLFEGVEKMVTPPDCATFYEDSANWSEKIMTAAKEMGFTNTYWHSATSKTGECYLVLGIIFKGQMYICDYFNALREHDSQTLFIKMNSYMAKYSIVKLSPYQLKTA